MNSLTPPATRLLERLKVGSGDDIAIPSVYPDALASMTHSVAFLSNAQALAEYGHRPDFAIFGVLYSLRHGLELFLKCLCQNRLTDELLKRISDGASLEESLEHLRKDRRTGNRDGKKQGKDLLTALSVLRNVDIDGLKAPECQHDNMATELDHGFAEAGLKYIQENGRLPRYHFSLLWIPSVSTHDLGKLWEWAQPSFSEMNGAVSTFVKHSTGDTVLSETDVAAVCEVFHNWDPRGDAIRYARSNEPVGMSLWNIHLPPLSLKAVAMLASELEQTVNAYDGLLEQCYAFATLGSPHPDYESMALY